MTNNKRISEARKVTWIGFIINLLLTTFKLSAGFLGKSTAMVADGVHSLSDFVTDLIVIIFIGMSGKEKDDDHKYGHGKYETFATLIISLVLFIVGIGIFWNGLSKVLGVINGEILEQPTIIALIAAILSVIVKEAMFWYTKIIGERIDSQAVIANGWHHRSDAFSSIGTALGIGGAIFLGEHWRILDPIAGIIVSLFIAKVSIELGLPSVQELLEKSLPIEIEKEIIDIISFDKEILLHHNLKTRKIGSIYAIDVHIKLDQNISFVHSHDIATDLEQRLKNRFSLNTIINIHTEPYKA